MYVHIFVQLRNDSALSKQKISNDNFVEIKPFMIDFPILRYYINSCELFSSA